MITLFITVACNFEMLLPKQNDILEKVVNKCICILNPSSVFSRKRIIISVYPVLSGTSSPYTPLIGVDRYRYVWCGRPRKTSKRGTAASVVTQWTEVNFTSLYKLTHSRRASHGAWHVSKWVGQLSQSINKYQTITCERHSPETLKLAL